MSDIPKGAKAWIRRIPQEQVSINGDVATVILTRVYTAIIDAADAEEVGQHCWCIYQSGDRVYAQRGAGEGNKKVSMHRQLMGFPDCDVDHANQNTLDNRKANLRACNRSRNNANSDKRSNLGAHPYKGAYPTLSGKWMARIADGNGGLNYMGSFDTIEEAAKVYDAAAKERYGDFAVLNFSGE